LAIKRIQALIPILRDPNAIFCSLRTFCVFLTISRAAVLQWTNDFNRILNLQEQGTPMKRIENLILLLLTVTSSATLSLAQSSSGGGEACGALGCGVFAIVYIVILVAILGGAVALIVYVIKFIKRDATARGMPNADSIKWLGLLGLLGLLIYLMQRPQGNVQPCPSCGQPRMQGLPQCPHCGNA
jgi:hypothetical protein